MKFNLIYLLLFLIPTITFSQYSVEGEVVNAKNEQLPYANVAFYKQADSTFVEGTITEENGKFLFNDIFEGLYILEVSFIGYQTSKQNIKINTNTKLAKIKLQQDSENLDEVNISTKKPSVRKVTDRLIFDIENTSISSGTTWDAIKIAPGVVSIGDDLKIRNTTATIYINEKKVDLTAEELKQLLEGFSAENVKQIEVLRNPSAKYDAGDGPIINIVTSKVLVPGYKGSIHKSYTQAIYAKYNLGTSHYYKNDKLNIFANYNFNPSKRFKQDESYVNYIQNEDEVFQRWRTDFDRTTREKSHQANIILDYQLSEKNSVSFSSNGIYSPNKTYKNRGTTNIYNEGFELDSLFNTKSNLENDLVNIGYDLSFSHQFKPQTSIVANVHSTYYDDQTQQFLATNYEDANNNLLNENSFSTQAAQKTNIYTGQLDFETVFGKFAFSSGIKLSDINTTSELQFLEVNSNAPAFEDNYLSDKFNYDENVYAAYSSVNRDWDKFSAQLGLRVEHTDRTGKSFSLNQINSRKYTELFPSVYLNYKASENHGFGFDYGRKIHRPKYESLNPFRYFITENSYQSGNPNLRAVISNEFNLNYTYKNKYSIDLYYRDNGRNVANLIFQDNENLFLRLLQTNVVESKSCGIDFFHGRSLKSWWYAQAVLSAFHEEETFLALESNFAQVTNDVNGFYASIYNAITLSKENSLTGHVNILYISDFIQGSYQVGDQFNLSFGLRKKIWKSKGELSLYVSDVFNEYAPQLNSTYLNQDNGYYALPENRFVRIGFKYNFGNSGLRDNNRSIDVEERDRL
ncbi:outer membrane beta-barrel family protein [Mesonia sp.]|uniref:outer membrane beta-barrel family protein n=1 Tax=Mesonia sp. TaxID=1960830 RepID=UPI001762140D|nr:outer membrane beta-barrel family protein [Mesonia sp.]HIB37273.1 TonB-dependent receptor [Mesonia sp.]